MMRVLVLVLGVLLSSCRPHPPAAAAPRGRAGATNRDCPERPSAWPLAVASKDALRALGSFRPGPEWRHFDYRGLAVAAAIDVLPSDGESYIDVYGYVHNRHFREWRRFFAVQIRGAGLLELRLDEATGTLAAVGAANNDLKDQPLFAFDLRAVHDDR
jgi:hypothetical protein